jgi:hypothetical protein
MALRDRFVAAYRAFREPQLVMKSPLDWEDFADFESRRNRYAILWAFFENSAYRSMHDWSHTYKIKYGLYRYIRHIYNPAHRLGTFWQTHLLGGRLDPAAGDGVRLPTAIPIVTGERLSEEQDQALRMAIAEVWRTSNWKVRKDIFTLWGSVFGDVALGVVDDTERGKVYLEVVNPSIIQDVELDPFGNVKAYIFEEARPHPETGRTTVTYREECTRSGDKVIYRTYLNKQPYAWPGQDGAEWELPYGFVPLVMVRHYDVGLDWGWSEMHAGRVKFQEVDDLASKLHDQVRKMVDAPWLLSGVDKPGSTPTTTSRDSETYQEGSSALKRPYPGREEMPFLYGPVGAEAKELVANLDIAATAGVIGDLLEELERDYPELQMDIWSASAQTSGRALRVARQRAESKVRLRRVNYDDGLVAAQQMAVAIGGWRGYEEFAGFDLDSYGKGLLDHSIDKRAVFAQDPMDDTEIEEAEWRAVNEAVRAGVPLEFYLQEEKGWDEEKIRRLQQALEGQAWRGMDARPPWLNSGGSSETEDDEE